MQHARIPERVFRRAAAERGEVAASLRGLESTIPALSMIRPSEFSGNFRRPQSAAKCVRDRSIRSIFDATPVAVTGCTLLRRMSPAFPDSFAEGWGVPDETHFDGGHLFRPIRFAPIGDSW